MTKTRLGIILVSVIVLLTVTGCIVPGDWQKRLATVQKCSIELYDLQEIVVNNAIKRINTNPAMPTIAVVAIENCGDEKSKVEVILAAEPIGVIMVQTTLYDGVYVMTEPINVPIEAGIKVTLYAFLDGKLMRQKVL